jgi:hypothetical protein
MLVHEVSRVVHDPATGQRLVRLMTIQEIVVDADGPDQIRVVSSIRECSD